MHVRAEACTESANVAGVSQGGQSVVCCVQKSKQAIHFRDADQGLAVAAVVEGIMDKTAYYKRDRTVCSCTMVVNLEI